MTNDQALSSKLWPHPFRWENYVDVFHEAPIWRWALNTFIYSFLATLGVLCLEHPGRLCARRGCAGAGATSPSPLVLVALMLPPQVTIVPLYVMWAKLHLVGTLAPLIIPNWFGDAFSIFLLRQFFLTIPEEYLDAARVDGCGELRILVTVVAAAREAGDRRRRPLLVPLHLQRLLPAAALPAREPAATGCCRSASPQFRSLHQVQWNLTMAATLLVHGAGDRPLLPRAEGVRRGRDADGGEGMKIAVIGGGSTYTPELVSGLSRERDRIDVRELVLHDIDAGAARGRRRARAAHARARRASPGGWRSPTISTARSTAPTSS